MNQSQMKIGRCLPVLFVATLLAACSTFDNIESGSKVEFEKPVLLRSTTWIDDSGQDVLKSATEPEGSVLIDAPEPVPFSSRANLVDADLEGALEGPPIAVNFNRLPLPAFINEVFAKQLKLSYTLAPGLNEQTDLVTLSLAQPQSPADLFRTAKMVLADYGISIRQSGEMLRFTPDENASGSSVPLMVSGRALPEVPPSHRPVFSIIQLTVVRNTQVIQWINELFKGTDVQTFEDPERNAVLLKGPADMVQQAVGAIEMLDQPVMKGRHARSLSPAFMGVKQLTDALIKILTAEGYAASASPPFGSVMVLPLVEASRIIVFAGTEAILTHVMDWARQLDQQHQEAIMDGVFRYEVQNIQATVIVDLLNKLAAGSSDTPGQASFSGGRLVVNENLNVIYFKGNGKAWMDLLVTIKQMDKPIPSVLLEVLLAEVTLNDQEDSGIEWFFRSAGFNHLGLLGGTRGGLDLGGSGLTLTFDSAGVTRAVINAFYRNSRAVIRASPRILVKSGMTATIDVGNEIPIITSKAQSVASADAPIIQTIQYRRTGVRLTVKPIVQPSGLVDIDISQELSEQQITQASSIGSPIILTRSLTTSLTLKDGGSVLLGGLISTSFSEGEDGVPVLGKIPFFGKLFRTNTIKKGRTELLVLITPYVIRSHADAVDITESFRQLLSVE